MPRAGLTRERVVEAAVKIVEQRGMDGFSMRQLAESLNIKPASLYNHVKSMDALMAELCAYALQMQWKAETEAIGEKKRGEAIFSLAEAYRGFAKGHRELYRLIIRVAASGDSIPAESTRCIVGPILQVLGDYELTQEETYHWQRILRGVMHGFVSQEDAGFFCHLPVEVEESFHMAIEACIVALEQTERGRSHAH